jgi:hypothetical protein
MYEVDEKFVHEIFFSPENAWTQKAKSGDSRCTPRGGLVDRTKYVMPCRTVEPLDVEFGEPRQPLRKCADGRNGAAGPLMGHSWASHGPLMVFPALVPRQNKANVGVPTGIWLPLRRIRQFLVSRGTRLIEICTNRSKLLQNWASIEIN